MSFNPRQDVGSPGLVYDKVYASKKEMDEKVSKDLIAIGRYVIVLYPREIRNNQVVINAPNDEQGYWDTGIFQKQYNATSKSYFYEFITFLGVLNEIPPAKNAIVMVDENRNISYNTQQDDAWIKAVQKYVIIPQDQITGSPKTLRLYEYKNGKYELTKDVYKQTGKIYYQYLPLLTHELNTKGYEENFESEMSTPNNQRVVISIPKFTVDKAGHIKGIDAAMTDLEISFANMQSLAVLPFATQPE